MVRKRSRTSRKHYESEENDTDSDFALDDPPAEPAAKKYSLRQRKRSLFLADYEYEDDEDIPAPKPESDDDFEIENEPVVNEPPPRRKSNVYINVPETSMPDDELIDFEDVIRADIVVNRNRIDYDNLISKTEIKVQPLENEPKPVKAKRGRKPKIRPPTEVDSSILEPETEVQEEFDDLNDRDYDPLEDLVVGNEAASCANTEIQDEDNKQLISENSVDQIEQPTENESNIHSNLECKENSTDIPDSTSVRDNTEVGTVENNSDDDDVCEVPIETTLPEERGIIQKNPQESVIKFNETALQVNGNNHQVEQSEVHLEYKQEVNEDDDDVVFVEDKNSEVIVLDD